ncbi:TPA: phage DNA ejection protein [Escherichia coli]|nr:phage DNA ejection protein [Escherichia coli]HDZ3827247.1 phage DNA ejection protein [Escherichia coli]HDZ3837097.1 phage DNA ejection protein [Escherichia coli]HDZ3842092.1 phage DNA ejection protein [Escherichia coli]HDZ3852104.1 phage DNA ejection protein [Escherichia coli]
MATWQGSNGGLLAGIGGVNSNAPSVNDIGNTLQLIRQNNDIERSGANNVGLTALQGLSGIAGVFQQEKQAQRQKEFQQAYANAYASGDRGALRQLATQYPDQIESVRKGMGFIDEDQRNSIGTLAAGARLASSSPEAMQSWLQNNAKELTRVGVDPNNVAQMYQQNPSGFGEFVDHLGMAALGPIDYFNVQDKMAGREIDRGKLAETIRSNQAGEALTARGQNITMRGQDLSASTARRGQDLAMQRASTRGIAGNDERTVQLSDGRTVTVGGKLHGAGANAFYEGIDNEGNMVRVPASSIAAPATSAANAQNYEMKKDLDAISGASIDDLGFMTGITGSSGSFALGADIRSRASGGDQRRLYNAAQRIMGKMQNQGIAAARDMGASGINTEAEANRYFQGMPKPDFSSPEALQQSMRDIQQYTDNYNQQYNVNVGKPQRQQSQPAQVSQPAASSNFSSLWGD